MLVGQLEDVLAEIEGPGLDTDLFARMSPDDVGLVRVALGQDTDAEWDEDALEDDGLDLSLDADDGEAETGETEQDDVEEEIGRLQAEIASSRRAQAALGRYLELLSGPPAG